MNPEVREVFLKRSHLVHPCAAFSIPTALLRWKLPMMQSVAGGAVARPFVTHHNALDIDFFLRIAPELYLEAPAGGRSRPGL